VNTVKKLIIGSAAVAAISAALTQVLPDVKRYLQMRKM
jgi:hypothetical protein